MTPPKVSSLRPKWTLVSTSPDVTVEYSCRRRQGDTVCDFSSAFRALVDRSPRVLEAVATIAGRRDAVGAAHVDGIRLERNGRPVVYLDRTGEREGRTAVVAMEKL